MIAAKKTTRSPPPPAIPRSPFRDIPSPAVVVTGASSGIGAAAAAELARRGFFVFGCVRKLEDADFLVAELGPTRFAAVLMDVCDAGSVQRAAEFVGEALVEGRSGEGWLIEKGGEQEEEGQRQQQQQKSGGKGGKGAEGVAAAAAAGAGGAGAFKKKSISSSLTPHSPRRRVRAASGTALLAGLVNCAGVAVPGPLLHQPLSEVRRHMEVNFFGATCVMQAFAPLLGAGRGERTAERKEAGVNTGLESASSSPSSSSFSPAATTAAAASSSSSSSSSSYSSNSSSFSRFAASSFPVSNPGTIVQISSTAGKLSAPFIGAYAASKHALEASSDALRRELFPYKVDVLVVEPGAVATPIWDKAEHHDVSAYDETPYRVPLKVFGEIVRAEGRAGHSPQRIARIVADLLDKTQKKNKKGLFPSFLTFSKPPTRTTCVFRRVKNWTLPHLLPDRLSDLVVAALLGMLSGPFFGNDPAGVEKKERASAVAAAAPSAAAAAAPIKKSSSSEEQQQQQQLLIARRAVAAAAFVAAAVSFVWRVAAAS